MTKDQVKERIESEVSYETIIHDEDIPVRGNCMASGDDKLDKEVEDEIISRLESGDLWAWCCVEVRARWKGFEGKDFLGCCSYASQKDFEKDGCYQDMKCEALDDLCEYILSLKETIDTL